MDTRLIFRDTVMFDGGTKGCTYGDLLDCRLGNEDVV